MKTEIFISVVVATHKRPKLLARCLKSILQQNVSHEIILCADEGTVETKTIASMYLRETDTFVAVPNKKGPAATRNIGVSLANGKWICFLDDDDSFDEKYFEKIQEILKSNKNKINYFNFNSIKEDEDLNPTEIIKNNLANNGIKNLWTCNFIPNNSLMIPSYMAKNVSIDEKLQSHEDWDYILSLLDKYEFLHHPISGPNVHRFSDQSRNQDSIKSKSYLLDFMAIYRKWPVNEDLIKISRKKFLESRGISLPVEFL